MGSGWRDCIVCFIDLDGTKAAAEVPKAGSKLMRQFHQLVETQLAIGLPSIAHAYTWNDSVLLLAYVGEPQSYVTVMREVDQLKRAIDALCKSHGVAVKGRAFPVLPSGDAVASRLTRLHASSWAMANCFEIEKALGNKRAAWYVDGRIGRQLPSTSEFRKYPAKLLPSGRLRVIHCFGSYIWPSDGAKRIAQVGR